MSYPIKLTFKSEVVPVVLLAIAWILAFYFYGHFPAHVVGHWNFYGQPDRYTSRANAAFAIPALLTGMYALFLALPLLDPRSERYQEFGKVYHFFKGAIIAILFIIYIASSLYNLGYPVNIGTVVPVLIGLLFVGLGNYMGKIKSNWFVGVRTPWTLSSENVWNKTNRFGGFMMMLFGVVLLLTPFLPREAALALFIVGLVLMTLGTFVYSFLLYRKEKNKTNNFAPR